MTMVREQTNADEQCKSVITHFLFVKGSKFMTSNSFKRPRTYVSTINLNVDDIDSSPREEDRAPYQYEDTTSSNSEKRKTRSCFIVLILTLVIISLLTIASLIIAIYSLVSSMSKSQTVATPPSTSTTSPTVNIISAGLVCSPSPLTSYEYSTAIPSQCLNYTSNIDPTRNIAYTQSINYCDNVSPFNSTTPTWIRFQDPAGRLIPNRPISPNSCGAVATGWYAGQYPIEFYTTATSIVCFYYNTNTCAACSLVSVTNCKTFYVFRLPKPDACNYRYCTL